MFSYLLKELLTNLTTGVRIVVNGIARGFGTFWAKIRQATRIADKVPKAMSKAAGTISQAGQKPTKRSDFVETKRMYISKAFIIRTLLILLFAILLICFVAYPLLMRYFFTAKMHNENTRLQDYTGKVIVYYDKDKTVPQYTGYMKDGLLQGKGKEYDTNGTLTYIGEFVDGKCQGQGEEYVDGELLYRGEFVYGVYSGKGEQYESGLKVCSGTYTDGLLDGSDCYLYHPNGKVAYRGAFAAGEQTGEGVAYTDTGIQTYEGGFERGEWSGVGTAYNAAGEPLYSGEFAKGLYEGGGTLYLDDGFRMESSFSQGVQGGDTTITQKGIVYYTGTAIEGKMNGQGVLLDRLGNTLYSGTMNGDTIDGGQLLGLTLDKVTELLGGANSLTMEEKAKGVLLTSESLGLKVFFSYPADGSAIAYDVFLYRSARGDAVIQKLLWHFADDIDTWRSELWGGQPMAAGSAVPQYAAEAYNDRSYPCVVYPDGRKSCTIWSNEQGVFGIQWTLAGGQAVTPKPTTAIQ